MFWFFLNLSMVNGFIPEKLPAKGSDASKIIVANSSSFSSLDTMVKNGPQILESELSPPLQQSKICRHSVGKLEDQKRACAMCPKAGRRRQEGQGCTFKTLYAREQCGIPLCCQMRGERSCFDEWHS